MPIRRSDCATAPVTDPGFYRGSANPEVGEPTYYLGHLFSRKLHEIEKKLDCGPSFRLANDHIETMADSGYPVGAPTLYFTIFPKWIHKIEKNLVCKGW